MIWRSTYEEICRLGGYKYIFVLLQKGINLTKHFWWLRMESYCGQLHDLTTNYHESSGLINIWRHPATSQFHTESLCYTCDMTVPSYQGCRRTEPSSWIRKRKRRKQSIYTRLTTPLSVIPANPHSEIAVSLPTHSAVEIRSSPPSVMWQPQQPRELHQENSRRYRQS